MNASPPLLCVMHPPYPPPSTRHLGVTLLNLSGGPWAGTWGLSCLGEGSWKGSWQSEVHQRHDSVHFLAFTGERALSPILKMWRLRLRGCVVT